MCSSDLHVQVRVTNTSGDRYGVHPLERDWDEGVVTWNDPDGPTGGDWQIDGALGAADRGDAVTVFNALTTGNYVVTLPPDLVQDWVDTPASNFGLVFSDPDFLNGLDLASGETSTPPTLVVTFEPAI